MARLVPAIPMMKVVCPPERDHRDSRLQRGPV